MPKDVDRKSDNKIIEFMARNKTETIRYLLALLVQFVFVNIIAIDKLVVHVNLPSLLKHHWIFYFKGELMLDFDVADGKGVLELKLRSFDHVFGSLEHKVDLELLRIEKQMHIFDVDLSFFADDLPLTQMHVHYVVEVYFVVPLG
jgi:hypothetical protein